MRFTSIFILLLALLGCDETDTRSELLSHSPWKYKWMKARANESDPWQSVPFRSGGLTLSLEACNMDDVTSYKTNGTYEITLGPNECTFEPTNLHGTWQLVEGDSKLVVVNAATGNPIMFTVYYLDEHHLQLEAKVATVFVQWTYQH